MPILGIGLTNPFASVNHISAGNCGRNSILCLQPKSGQQTNVSGGLLLFTECFCY